MQTAMDALCAALADLDIERDVPMRTLTTFGVGGPADVLLRAGAAEDVRRALHEAARLGLPVRILGNGSNLLVQDAGVRGLVVCIGGGLSAVQVEGSTIHAGAGALLSAVSKEALQAGLTGLEWAGGIPGTIGGACAMNAGAYGGSMADVLRKIHCLREGVLQTVTVQPGEMGYRKSPYAAPNCIVLSVELALQPDDGNAAARQAAYLEQRRQKQPLHARSAGSVFKRPPGHYAGALIEGAGLKGRRVGGAVVSSLHAGFILNEGGATAEDVLQLIELVRKRVYEAYGVELECEVQIW